MNQTVWEPLSPCIILSSFSRDVCWCLPLAWLCAAPWVTEMAKSPNSAPRRWKWISDSAAQRDTFCCLHKAQGGEGGGSRQACPLLGQAQWGPLQLTPLTRAAGCWPCYPLGLDEANWPLHRGATGKGLTELLSIPQALWEEGDTLCLRCRQWDSVPLPLLTGRVELPIQAFPYVSHYQWGK